MADERRADETREPEGAREGPREGKPPRMTEGGRRRLARTGTLSAAVLLVAALLAIVNYFGFKYYKRFDWTGSRLYSLSDKSKNVLADLDQDVETVVFLEPGEQLYEPVRELLARYEAASPHVKVRLVDQAKNPVEAQRLVQQYQVTSPSVVFAAGDERRVIDTAELADYDFSTVQLGQQPQMTGFKGEQLFTGAIVQLAEGRKPTIRFTTGHGEASLDDQGPRGLSQIREILGADNFELEEWSSLGQSAVPEGTDLVVIAGPTGSFLQPEVDALAAYVAKGGRLLALIDPVLGTATASGLNPTGLTGWLAGQGVRLGEDIVIDPANALPFFGPETVFARSYGEHPATRPLQQGNLPVLFTVVRSVNLGEAPPDLTVTSLVETSSEGWGETNLAALNRVGKDAADTAGPVSLGVAITRASDGPAPAEGTAPPAAPKPGDMRMVVFGDSDFAGNQLLEANVGNAVLVSNVFNWLVEREALLGIPPKKAESVHLSLSSSELRWVYLLSLVVLPGLGVLVGAVVWFRRRR